MTDTLKRHEELCALLVSKIGDLATASDKEMGVKCHVMIVAIPMTPSNSAEFFSVVHTFGGHPGGLLEIAQHLVELATLEVEHTAAIPKEKFN